MDRSRLAWLLANWCMGNPKGFTCKIKAQYRRTRRELSPVLSRIQNIGYDLGENGRSAEWYRANHKTPWVAGRLAGRGFHLTWAIRRPRRDPGPGLLQLQADWYNAAVRPGPPAVGTLGRIIRSPCGHRRLRETRPRSIEPPS